MEKIWSKRENEKLLHLVYRYSDVSGRQELLDPENFIQVASLKLDAAQEFKAHKHLDKKTNFDTFKAQESWVVIKGKVEVSFYDTDNTFIANSILTAGDISVTLDGGHSYKILENSIVYEFKTGPYFGAAADKSYF